MIVNPLACIPFAQGVPGAGGTPVWWDTTSGSKPDFNKRVDDPRWQGSLARTYPESGNGVGAEHAIFRALYADHPTTGQTCVFLSWWIQVDPVLSPTADQVTVGFQNMFTNEVYVLRLGAFPSIPADGLPHPT